ncbi:MAG: hypothetical protein PVJ75_01635, partial [Chloroflexota bacterium]
MNLVLWFVRCELQAASFEQLALSCQWRVNGVEWRVTAQLFSPIPDQRSSSPELYLTAPRDA